MLVALLEIGFHEDESRVAKPSQEGLVHKRARFLPGVLQGWPLSCICSLCVRCSGHCCKLTRTRRSYDAGHGKRKTGDVLAHERICSTGQRSLIDKAENRA